MNDVAAARKHARADSRIDYAMADRAISMARPLIDQAMRDPAHGDSGFLHVVVLDPVKQPGECEFADAILYEQSFGDRSRWDADYASFAYAKAETSWRERRDNEKGAVWLDGIVVGASGAFECFDQGYAGAVAAQLRALARHAGAWEPQC